MAAANRIMPRILLLPVGRWPRPDGTDNGERTTDNMNYLAHLFLAGDTAELLIGNLAGDFVKGPLRDEFTPGIREGIRQHRRLDAFTDTHPHMAAFRRV